VSAPVPNRRQTRPVRRAPRLRRLSRRAPGPQLTARDLEIVRFITRHGVVTSEDVATRFFWREEQNRPGIWAAYRRISALRWLGLILSDKPFANRPTVLRVTREGARLADVGIAPAPLVLSELNHSLAVVRVVEQLARDHPGAEITTERELRAERYRERREGDRPVGRGRTPDAILRLAKKDAKRTTETIAIEVDITRKDRRALERIILAYDHELDVDRVWWYVSPRRAERVRDVVRSLRAERRIEIREWRG